MSRARTISRKITRQKEQQHEVEIPHETGREHQKPFLRFQTGERHPRLPFGGQVLEDKLYFKKIIIIIIIKNQGSTTVLAHKMTVEEKSEPEKEAGYNGE